jgi:hypothetical protein
MLCYAVLPKAVVARRESMSELRKDLESLQRESQGGEGPGSRLRNAFKKVRAAPSRPTRFTAPATLPPSPQTMVLNRVAAAFGGSPNSKRPGSAGFAGVVPDAVPEAIKATDDYDPKAFDPRLI